MIAVTRLDGSGLVVNTDLIERVERTPDTLVVMSGGERLYVREAPEEIIRRVIAYKRAIYASPVVVPLGRLPVDAEVEP